MGFDASTAINRGHDGTIVHRNRHRVQAMAIGYLFKLNKSARFSGAILSDFHGRHQFENVRVRVGAYYPA